MLPLRRRHVHAEAAPVVTSTCWCRHCQILGAGSGTVNVGLPSERLVVAGAMSHYVSVAANGSHRHCSRCGTPMFSEAEERPTLVYIRVGALEDPNTVHPSRTISTRSAPRWACLDPGLPRVADQPPPA